MTFNLQGIIIALLIGFLVGIVLVFLSLQGRLRRQAIALKESQKQLEGMEKAHEARLRDATRQLRQDYENQLSEKIEHYQDQLADKLLELEQEYRDRQEVILQGTVAMAPTEPVETLRGLPIEPTPVAEPLPPAEVVQLKQQYETRLKEAAQKLQKAYEQRLAERIGATKAELQHNHELWLAEKIEHYEAQLATRTSQLEAEYEARYQALVPGAKTMATVIPQSPSAIMGVRDETTMTLPPAHLKAVPSPDAPDAFADRLAQAMQQVRVDYERQFTEKLERYQAQVTQRITELEREYRARLEPSPPPPSSVEGFSSQGSGDDFDPLDLSDISQLS